jgi:Mannose-6-phosphate isomerase
MRGGDGSVAALKLLSEGEFCPNFRLFSIMTLKPGCSIGPHSHSMETEYYYILSGSGIVSEADGEKAVRKGDLVITGGGASHAIRNSGNEDLIFLAAIITE